MLVPEEGEQITHRFRFGDQMVDVNMYMARDGWSVFTCVWFTGPTYGETDVACD